jgi:hypothetical protein
MNQQIQQLAEQAGMVRILNEHAHEYGNGTFENTPYPELEKFAELIVEECATVIERNLFQGIGWNTSKAVRRHFGVYKEEE